MPMRSFTASLIFCLQPAQIAFGGLHGNVSEKELDLLEFAASNVTEPGACASIMRH
jgi:hypothetical protein